MSSLGVVAICRLEAREFQSSTGVMVVGNGVGHISVTPRTPV